MKPHHHHMLTRHFRPHPHPLRNEGELLPHTHLRNEVNSSPPPTTHKPKKLDLMLKVYDH